MTVKVLVVLLTFLSSGLACQQNITFSRSLCTFQLQYSDTNCSSSAFQFLQCTWNECTSYDPSTQLCFNYITKANTNWQSCTLRCCDPDVAYPQTSQAIENCKYYQKETESSKIVTGVIVALFMASLCLVCFCCGCCNKLFSSQSSQNLNLCRDRLVQCIIYAITCGCCQQKVVSAGNNQSGRNIYTNNQLQGPQCGSWQFEKDTNPNLETICSVCLQSGPTLQLECGHIYHRKCIIECLRRKKECILCRSSAFDFVTVYCEDCQMYYFRTYLTKQMRSLDQEKQVCRACKEKAIDPEAEV